MRQGSLSRGAYSPNTATLRPEVEERPPWPISPETCRRSVIAVAEPSRREPSSTPYKVRVLRVGLGGSELKERKRAARWWWLVAACSIGPRSHPDGIVADRRRRRAGHARLVGGSQISVRGGSIGRLRISTLIGGMRTPAPLRRCMIRGHGQHLKPWLHRWCEEAGPCARRTT